MGQTLIVCIGNDLVADDAVGFHVCHLLRELTLPDDVRVCLLGVGGMALLDELAGEELLVVVDAVQFGADPGTVHVLEWDEIPASDMRPVSGHGIGIREALQVCRKLYPEKAASSVYLVGIEGECFDRVGQGPTASVLRALPKAIDSIMALIG